MFMVMSLPRWIRLTTVLLLGATSGLRADVVVLHNGDRIVGEIVAETDKEIHVRRSAYRNVGRYVDVIERFRIARVERDDNPVATQPAEDAARAPEARPSAGSSEGLTEPDAAMQRSLALAIARWQAEDFEGAGLDLSRLINSATAGQLEALSEDARQRAGRTLAELAADAHFRAATQRRGRAIRLSYVTEYEKPALIPKLIDAFDAALRAEVPPVGSDSDNVANREDRRARRGSATRPADEEDHEAATSRPAEVPETQPAPQTEVYRIVDWLGRPDEFNAPPRTAEALAGHIHYAASLLAERLRLDPDVRRDRTLRSDLARQRFRLLDLAKVASNRARGTPATAARNAEATDLERMRREYIEQRMRLEQREEMLRLREAARLAEQMQQKNQGGEIQGAGTPTGGTNTGVATPENKPSGSDSRP